MRIALVLFSAGLLIDFASTQRNPNFTKPIVNLAKRPRPPVWNRPPEERRRLSIFPKNNMKFVVTPKTVTNDDPVKEGLPTKRPLMRKFVMQEKNEKGTWSFAPREPLMKSKRFTVTLAPPKLTNRKPIDEMEFDESKKVKTILNRLNMEQKLDKSLNKGNLIEMMQNKNKQENSSGSKTLIKVEQKFVSEEVSDLLKENDTTHFDVILMNENKIETSELIKVNDTEIFNVILMNENKTEVSDLLQVVDLKYFDKIEMNGNKTEISKLLKVNDTKSYNVIQMDENTTVNAPVINSEDYVIDASISKNGILNANDTTNKEDSTHEVIEFIKTPKNLNPEKAPEDLVESKAVDLNEIEFPMDLNENNYLITNDKETNNDRTEQGLSFNDLEILLEKIVNSTEEFNVKLASDSNVNDTRAPNNETNDVIDDIPQFDSTKPNKFYEVVSLSNDDDGKTMAEDDSVTESIIQDSLDMANDEMHIASVTNELNNEEDLTDNTVGSLVVGNLESLLKFMEKEAVGFKTDELSNGELIPDRRESFGDNGQEVEIDIVNTSSEKSTKNSVEEEKAGYFMVNGTVDELEDELNETSTTNTPVEDVTVSYFMVDVTIDELKAELNEKSTTNTPVEDETVSYFMVNSTVDELEAELNEKSTTNTTVEDETASYFMVNGTVDELEAEFNEKSTTNTPVEDETASYFMVNGTVDEVEVELNEKLMFHDSSHLNSEEMSLEMYAPKKKSSSEEKSTESLPNEDSNEVFNETVTQNLNLSVEETSSEEAFNANLNSLTGEENSKESISDTSINYTERLSNESMIDKSNNLTDEIISNESSSNMAEEELSNESYVDKSKYLTEEVSNESKIETSSNLTEEISNESTSGTSNNLTEEISKEFVTETSNNFAGEETSDESLIDRSDNVTYERIPDESVVSSENSSVEEISSEALINRFKRNSNIIEEENLATTLSGFKYTGHENRLNHDLSYKNINA